MATLYIINGQTVYSFCFSTRCKTTRTTSLGVNKRTSTREVPNPLVIVLVILMLHQIPGKPQPHDTNNLWKVMATGIPCNVQTIPDDVPQELSKVLG